MNRLLNALARPLRRFVREQDGGPTVEFVILVVPVLLLLMTGAEAGLLNMRNVMLERGTDIAMRAVRLNPTTPPTHDQVKQLICDQAMLLPDCMNSLMVEMRSVPKTNWATIAADADCTDRSEGIKPVTRFMPGRSSELMLVRACIKARPIFPTTGLGLMMRKDAAGDYAAVATAAFVNEP
ncbi:pilus assembly protein [Oceaniovalibus sp. ACAM 378]|uniref:pilus assembly protein n=1 Tax=Oceaniovalibus sp. ACAM 378 TaxID=2599923 RepID=UPI0011D8E48F|nr:pilus assembly protein [Oceaniovalibus sp. ACAM 378]TYB87664.1 pilus assembly protein [Oceaniovalibus sp. ACAM 378]